MQSKLNPYLSFEKNTREVMEFYKSIFGGELTISTFKDGGMEVPDELADNTMHAELVAKNGITIMASDLPPGDTTYKKGTNVSISLSGDDTAELTSYYNKLAVGGSVVEPLKKAPWGDTFGMLTDKYGIFWLVNIAGKKS